MEITGGTLATYHIGSDCYPYEVLRVSESKKVLWATEKYKYDLPGLRLVEIKFTLRKDGKYRKPKCNYGYLSFGEAIYSMDPSF